MIASESSIAFSSIPCAAQPAVAQLTQKLPAKQPQLRTEIRPLPVKVADDSYVVYDNFMRLHSSMMNKFENDIKRLPSLESTRNAMYPQLQDLKDLLHAAENELVKARSDQLLKSRPAPPPAPLASQNSSDDAEAPPAPPPPAPKRSRKRKTPENGLPAPRAPNRLKASQEMISCSAKIVKIKDQITSVEQAIKDIGKMITSLQNRDEQNQYLLEVASLLNTFHYNKAQMTQTMPGSELYKSLEKELISVYNQYLQQFRPDLLSVGQKDAVSRADANSMICRCGGDIEIIDSERVCVKCGLCEFGEVTANTESCDYQTRNDISSRSRVYTYRRINHFREGLRQIQGKCTSRIDEAVYDALREEFKKKARKLETLRPEHVRESLRKLQLSNLYESAVAITTHLNNAYVPLEISPEKEEILCYMFVLTEIPFHKIRSVIQPDRKNFLSYPFILYKLSELMGYNEILPHITLLKSTNLLINQDRWWRGVCQQLKWKYYVTVGNVLKNDDGVVALPVRVVTDEEKSKN